MRNLPGVLRWPARTIVHVIDGHAWIGSALAALLAGGAVLEAQLGATGSLTKAAADALGFWSGRLSLGIFLAVLLQAAARAGMDEQMERMRVSPDHVDDLHQEAAFIRQRIHTPQDFVLVDLTSVWGGYFSQHFPDVAATVELWNQSTNERRQALDALFVREDSDATRPIENTSLTISGVIAAVTRGNYASPMDWIWRAGPPSSPPNTLWFYDTKTRQDITLGTVPTDGDGMALAAECQSHLMEASSWPEAVRYRESVDTLQQLRRELDRQLETVQLNHTPRGVCEGCDPKRTRP